MATICLAPSRGRPHAGEEYCVAVCPWLGSFRLAYAAGHDGSLDVGIFVVSH